MCAFEPSARERGGGGYFGQFLLGMYRWHLGTFTPLESISVTVFGQL